MRQVEKLGNRKQYPVQTGKELEVLYSDSGRVKARIKAPYSQRYQTENPYLEFPKGIEVYFYDSASVLKSTLKANYAISREKEKLMEARGNVIVVNSKSEQLNTEELIWDEKREKIISNKFVKITTPDKIIFGEGLESNQDFTYYRIFNIKGTIQVKNE